MTQQQLLVDVKPALARKIELTISPGHRSGQTCSEIASGIAERLLSSQARPTCLVCPACRGAIECFTMPGTGFSDCRFPVYSCHVCQGCGAVSYYHLEIVNVGSDEEKPVFCCYLCGVRVNLGEKPE